MHKPVLVLAVCAAVENYVAFLTTIVAWVSTSLAYLKYFHQALVLRHFPGNRQTIVDSIRLGSVLEQKLGENLGPALGSDVQWRVPLIICHVDVGAEFQQDRQGVYVFAKLYPLK